MGHSVKSMLNQVYQLSVIFLKWFFSCHTKPSKFCNILSCNLGYITCHKTTLWQKRQNSHRLLWASDRCKSDQQAQAVPPDLQCRLSKADLCIPFPSEQRKYSPQNDVIVQSSSICIWAPLEALILGGILKSTPVL